MKAFMAGILLLPAVAWADTPAFDRPGIAFSTATLPAGSFMIEQGLPDFERDASGGVRTMLYAADSRLRAGLLPTLELQLATSLYNRVEMRGGGTSSHVDGTADTALALKWAPPTASPRFSWAALAGLSFPSGDAAFTADHPVYSLGATGGWKPGDTQAAAFYVNADHADGKTLWTLSPNWGVALGDSVGVYIEAGRSFGDGSEETVAGGGLTWMVLPTVQLDTYALRGLTDESTDLQAGFGVSAFFY